MDTELNKIIEGIDYDECDPRCDVEGAADAWWETTAGANFGIEIKQRLNVLFDKKSAEINQLREQNKALKKEKDNALDSLDDLRIKVNTYRNLYDLFGGGDIRAGRAWDKMRQAEYKAADFLKAAKEGEQSN